MTDPQDKIYDSGPAQSDDDFWLGQGRKMAEESLPAVREAAKALMTGLGVLQGIYIGILGFGETAKRLTWETGLFAALPLVAWMVALLFCLRVMMTSPGRICLHSPDSIRDDLEKMLREKQDQLRWAYRCLAIGLFLAIVAIALMSRLAPIGTADPNG